MEQNLLGSVFGVDIHAPLQRSEIRQLVKAKNTFIENKINEEHLTHQQASLDAGDVIDKFIGTLGDEHSDFLNLYTDETMAAIDATVDIQNISNQTEADSYHLQAEFIFNELSANLQVYGSNSAMVGANPANVDLALEYINRSLELDPENPIYLNLKGLLLWQGKTDRMNALPLIEKAAKLDPRNITIQHNLKSIQDPKGCFIATAAFGTPFALEVNELRLWRDNTLLKNNYTRFLVTTYYKLSPPIARIIASKPRLKSLVRACLRPIISYARKANRG